MRKEMLTELEHSWRNLHHPLWRIGFHSEIGKHKSAISEIRLLHLILDAVDRANWVGSPIKSHAAIGFINHLSIGEDGLKPQVTYRYVFNMHSIARRLERGSNSIDDLRLDMIGCLAFLPDEISNSIRIGDGSWKCARMQLRGVTDPCVCIGVKTWLSDQ